ncbi:cyclopropane-fatty-acyl-phospholipid synthase [Abortiporus biennis]|nr:cyclopropane-fatty-acyl-phospholipid synthase [Abortiporus biennis]
MLSTLSSHQSQNLTVQPTASRSNSSLSGTSQKPTKSWLGAFAKTSILSFLEQAIAVGYLEIEHSDGRSSFGQKPEESNTTSALIRVRDENFWNRVFISGDLGFSEAYMSGDIEVNDLKVVMNLWLDNQSNMIGLSSIVSRASSALSSLYITIFGQTKSQARLNAISSYDQSNELFKAFLSEEMMYSCALWGDEEGGVSGDLTSGPFPGDLEAAQKRKLQYVLKKARLRPGHRVLEFGSGWGGLAIEAAKTYDVEVDTLTLSKEQKALAEERIKEAGLEGRIRVHLMDYRDIPAEFENAFDAFISIEMLEHVGSQYYKKYFQLVHYALKPRNATVVVTSSTFPESRYSEYQAEDFMRKYMWPNSCLPSATTLITAAHSASAGQFTLEGVENHAAHYPRTLRTWGRRLEQNLRQDVIAARYPALNDPSEYLTFKRKWEYLFAYAGSGFTKGYITCHMLTFIRANDIPEQCL